MRNNPDDLSNQLIDKIKEWLQDEINTYQEIQTRISDGEEVENIADAPEVFFGRSECAEGLLSKIEEWEDGNKQNKNMGGFTTRRTNMVRSYVRD